ncbi:MAG: hypothetical protein ABMA64_23695 [Myxococcota bacterium]
MTRVTLTMLIWLAPGGEQALNTFREQAAPLWQQHDLRVERVLSGTGKGQLLGVNPHDVPDVLQVVSMPSLEAFRAYTTSPEYVRLSAARDRGIARMVAVIGEPLDVSAYNPVSQSDPSARQYGVAFARFLPGGAEGMDEFNRRAHALYVRHGMHVEAMVRVAKTVTPVGSELEDFAPERVVVFFVDDPAALKAYVADPEYQALAPVRDSGLRSYDFFLGRSAR